MTASQELAGFRQRLRLEFVQKPADPVRRLDKIDSIEELVSLVQVS